MPVIGHSNANMALCYCSACYGKERHPMSARYDLFLENLHSGVMVAGAGARGDDKGFFFSWRRTGKEITLWASPQRFTLFCQVREATREGRPVFSGISCQSYRILQDCTCSSGCLLVILRTNRNNYFDSESKHITTINKYIINITTQQ